MWVCVKTCVTRISWGVIRSRGRKWGVKTQLTPGWPLLNFIGKWHHLHPHTTKFEHSSRTAEPVTCYNLDMTSLERALPQKCKWKQHLSALPSLLRELGVLCRLTTNSEVDCFTCHLQGIWEKLLFQPCYFSILETNVSWRRMGDFEWDQITGQDEAEVKDNVTYSRVIAYKEI